MINKLEKEQNLKDIVYSLHLYFNSLSLRYTSKAISRFVKRVTLQLEIGYKRTNLKVYLKEKISEFIIDETQIKVGSELIWLWVVYQI